MTGFESLLTQRLQEARDFIDSHHVPSHVGQGHDPNYPREHILNRIDEALDLVLGRVYA